MGRGDGVFRVLRDAPTERKIHGQEQQAPEAHEPERGKSRDIKISNCFRIKGPRKREGVLIRRAHDPGDPDVDRGRERHEVHRTFGQQDASACDDTGIDRTADERALRSSRSHAPDCHNVANELDVGSIQVRP